MVKFPSFLKSRSGSILQPRELEEMGCLTYSIYLLIIAGCQKRWFLRSPSIMWTGCRRRDSLLKQRIYLKISVIHQLHGSFHYFSKLYEAWVYRSGQDFGGVRSIDLWPWKQQDWDPSSGDDTCCMNWVWQVSLKEVAAVPALTLSPLAFCSRLLSLASRPCMDAMMSPERSCRALRRYLSVCRSQDSPFSSLALSWSIWLSYLFMAPEKESKFVQALEIWDINNRKAASKNN